MKTNTSKKKSSCGIDVTSRCATLPQAQQAIRQFDEARGWGTRWDIKDLCLNMNEEIGELWHLIKWVDEESQRRLVREHMDEVSNWVADMLFLVLKAANQLGVESAPALEAVLAEYDRRMPPSVMLAVKHANKLAGGHDKKED